MQNRCRKIASQYKRLLIAGFEPSTTHTSAAIRTKWLWLNLRENKGSLQTKAWETAFKHKQIAVVRDNQVRIGSVFTKYKYLYTCIGGWYNFIGPSINSLIPACNVSTTKKEKENLG